jgi:hypothetical protein
MTKMRATGLVLVFCLGSVSWAVHAQTGKSREWLTWGGDIERTGWNRGESTLSKQNVGRLGLKWKTQIDKEVSIEIESGNLMLTTPLVAQGVSHSSGIENRRSYALAGNTLAALDAATGASIWRRSFDNTVESKERAELDLQPQYIDGHSSDRQGERHHLYAGGRRATARH